MEILEQIETKIEDAIRRITQLQVRVRQLEEEKANYEEQCKSLLRRLEATEDDDGEGEEDVEEEELSTTEDSEATESLETTEASETIDAEEESEGDDTTEERADADDSYEDHTPENSENSNEYQRHTPAGESYFASDESDTQQHY